MNTHTEAILDYPRIKCDLQAYTVTPMGNALAAQLQPHTDIATLEVHIQETSEMVTQLTAGNEPPLAPVSDMRPHLAAAQIEGCYLESWQLLEVANCLDVVQRLRRYGQGEIHHAPLLNRRIARLADLGLLLRQIRNAIDDKGQVRDHASPALQHVRQTLKRVRERVHNTLRGLMATHHTFVQDALITIRNGRFVVPLKTDFRQALRGIVHAESASGATVYVEPDSVVDLNNQLLHTRSEEERAVREVLRELTKRLAAQRVVFAQALRILGEIDFILAKGRLSLSMQGAAPRFTSRSRLRLIAARHPLLSTPVPIDIHLGPENRTLVITGPNTGGKTIALKTVGLLAIMAQSGLHIPASSDSVLPIFSDVFVDLGDEQSLQQNLSTFSAHLTNICGMMQHVSPCSLVLLDELGAGTDPMEGGPLGVALLDHFHQRGAMILTTTHHSMIKAFAMSTSQIECAAVDFDLATLQPRYRLVYGLPGRSKAFAIAQKIGVPPAVINRAQQEAGVTQMRNEEFLARLEAQQHALEKEQQHLQAARAELDRLQAQARETLARANTEERRIRQSFYTEGQALLKTVRQEIDTALAALRQQALATQPIAFPQEAWQRAVQVVDSLQPAEIDTPQQTESFAVGERVRVRSLNIIGCLRTQGGGNGTVQVEIGNKTVTIAASELERVAAGAEDTTSKPSSRRSHRGTPSAREEVSTELRILGYTVAEALAVVDKYLNHAFMQNIPRVRIIHGAGSGRLRDAVSDLLARHPLVCRFQVADTRGGTTIVELER